MIFFTVASQAATIARRPAFQAVVVTSLQQARGYLRRSQVETPQ
jgi:hypothetical protein